MRVEKALVRALVDAGVFEVAGMSPQGAVNGLCAAVLYETIKDVTDEVTANDPPTRAVKSKVLDVIRQKAFSYEEDVTQSGL